MGLAGVVAAAMLGLVHPTPALSINWALGGFSNPLSWLVLSTLVLASGYEKTALGRRIALWLIQRLGRSTLGLGYAIALTDLALAPFTPSNTARSAGTIYPVIRNIPGLFGSSPESEPRRLGAYILYTALAATCVTSSMFPTAIAAEPPRGGHRGGDHAHRHHLARVGDRLRARGRGALPPRAAGALLDLSARAEALARTRRAWAARGAPRHGADVARGAHHARRHPPRGRALDLRQPVHRSHRGRHPRAWSLLVARGIVSWEDVVGNRQAWNVFVWFSTLITLAGGLAEVGFVRWLADRIEAPMARAAFPYPLAGLVVAFFFLHYFFATVSGHAAALLPVFLIVATGPLDLSPRVAALSLGLHAGAHGHPHALRHRARAGVLRLRVHPEARLLVVRPRDGHDLPRRAIC